MSDQRGRQASLLYILVLCAFALAACSENGFSWRLYGWENHYFTVDGEEISLRLDTSGSGRYEVELQEDNICIAKDGVTILEGGFWDAEEIAAFMEEILASGDYQVIEKIPEDTPTFLIYCYCAGDVPEYAFLTLIEDSALGSVFSVPPGEASEDEARDYAHRVQISKTN